MDFFLLALIFFVFTANIVNCYFILKGRKYSLKKDHSERKKIGNKVQSFFGQKCSRVNSLITSLDYNMEFQKINFLKAEWHKKHPFGATNLQEKLELQNILYEEAGTRMAYDLEMGNQFKINDICEITRDAEDWL